MTHSKSIVIKCPACGNKFQAEREAEASFVSCPQCNIQVKISGMDEPRHRKSHLLPHISQLPAQKQRRESLKFLDLSKRSAESPPRAPREEVSRQNREDQGASAPSQETQSSSEEISLRNQKALEAKAAAKARAAAKAKAEAEAAARALSDAKSGKGKKTTPQTKGGRIEKPQAQVSSRAKPDPFEEDLDLDSEPQYEKIQVSTTGQRRRLHNAPAADLPDPKTRPERVQTLTDPRKIGDSEPGIKPTQSFAERKISQGGKWRRHKPEILANPEWDDDGNDAPNKKRGRSKKSTKLMWGAAIGLSLIVITAITLFLNQEVTERPTTKADLSSTLETSEAQAIADAFTKAEPLIREFLSATSTEQALTYVRDPQRIMLLMAKHYGEAGYQSQRVEEVGPMELCRISDGFLLVPLSLENYEPRSLAVEMTTNKIDWESWVGYSEMKFSELLIRQPKEPVLLRVFAKQEDYFNWNFTNSNDYISLRLLDATQEVALWGYVKIDSQTYREFAARMVAGVLSNEQRLTVYGQFPEATANPDRDQIEITDLVTFGWVVRDDPEP